MAITGYLLCFTSVVVVVVICLNVVVLRVG